MLDVIYYHKIFKKIEIKKGVEIAVNSKGTSSYIANIAITHHPALYTVCVCSSIELYTGT